MRRLDELDEIADALVDAEGAERVIVDVLAVEPDRTRWVRRPASTPARTSVSMRSPTIAALSECAPILFRPARIMTGFGLPTK